MCCKCDLVVTCLDQVHDMEQVQVSQHQIIYKRIIINIIIEYNLYVLCSTAQYTFSGFM